MSVILIFFSVMTKKQTYTSMFFMSDVASLLPRGLSKKYRSDGWNVNKISYWPVILF